MPLEWIGMNAMLVYVMAAEGIFAGFINGWYYEDPHYSLVSIPLILFSIPTLCFYILVTMWPSDERKRCADEYICYSSIVQ